MTVLTEKIKARKMDEAFAQLAKEYAVSENAAERACSTAVRKARLSLPSYSKAKLYDILQSVK